MDKIFRCGTAALHATIHFPDRRIKMGEIAFAVAGHKELPPRFLHAFQYGDRRSRTGGGNRRHHAGRSGPDYYDLSILLHLIPFSICNCSAPRRFRIRRTGKHEKCGP